MLSAITRVSAAYAVGLMVFLLVGLAYFGRSGRAQTMVRPEPPSRPGEYYTFEGGPKTSDTQGVIERPDGPADVVIELADEPAAQTFAATRSSNSDTAVIVNTRQQISRIETAQRQLLPSLNTIRAEVLYRTQRVYNGIAVRINSAQLDS